MKSIAEIAAIVTKVKKDTRTLNKYSEAIRSHLDVIRNDPKRAERAEKSLGQVFNGVTSGRDRVTPGMIMTLANNSLQALQSLRDDIAIDRHGHKGVKTDSALIRHGGAIVTKSSVDALEKAANDFKTLYQDFKSDVSLVKNADDTFSLTLDVVSETAEVVA